MRTPRFAHPGRVPASPRRGWGRAALVLAACTLLAELMVPHLDLANIIMVYLAGLVYVAVHEHVAVALGTVAGSVFLFDLIFVPPRWGLHPIDPHHVFTFGVMLAVGVLISQLASWARRQAELAEGRAQRADALSRLAERLASASSRQSVERAVAAVVGETFGARATLALEPVGAAPSPASFELVGTGAPLGRLELDAAATGWTAEDRQLLAAFAHQAALALERCAFEEKSAAAQVQVESERLRSTLLAGISHDFRTPLTTIVGAATVLLEQADRLDAQRRELLTRGVLDEARRLHSVMSDLLDLMRMEEGAVRLQHEWCPADDLVGEALAAFGDQARAVQVQVAPDAVVWCDPRLVQQALRNLVANALHHAPRGTAITVRVEVREPQWRLVVQDAGPGLPGGEDPAMFRKFRRGRNEPTSTGFGLGLAICAAVAQLHGGRIAAANVPGARITLELPQPARGEPPPAEAE